MSPTGRLKRDFEVLGECNMTLEQALELMEKWKTSFPNQVLSFDYETVERRVLTYLEERRGE